MNQQTPDTISPEQNVLLSLWAQTLAQSVAAGGQESTLGSLSPAELVKRVRILDTGARPVDGRQFQQILAGLLQRRQVRILYHGRSRDETSERVVSPQRLVRYRGNWYLDTWCHWREDLRHFALDRVHPVEILAEAARDVAEADLDQHFATAYGIFSGQAKSTAVLRFSPEAARWIADETWHPQQSKTILADGSVELRIPYGDNRELIMDILRYGPDCEVMAPPGLRDRVAQLAARTAALYRPRRR